MNSRSKGLPSTLEIILVTRKKKVCSSRERGEEGVEDKRSGFAGRMEDRTDGFDVESRPSP
jgi:hypothetical protein